MTVSINININIVSTVNTVLTVNLIASASEVISCLFLVDCHPSIAAVVDHNLATHLYDTANGCWNLPAPLLCSVLFLVLFRTRTATALIF